MVQKFMEDRIMDDVERLLKENKEKGWSLKFALVILAGRYTSPEYRQATVEVFDKLEREGKLG